MTAPPDMAERHRRQLAELAEQGMDLARRLHTLGMAEDDPDAAGTIADAHARVSRAVRQSVALEAKLVRDAERAAAAARREADEDRARAVGVRKAQVRARVERQLFTEVTGRDADIRMADFDERLESEALYDRFLDEPLDAQVDRLAAELDLCGQAVRAYVPRLLRSRPNNPYLFRRSLGLGPLDDDPPGEAEAAPPPQPPPRPPPPPPDLNGRLAPPMDLPSWETE